MNPFELFEHWHQQEMEQNKLKLPAACCLSTIGLDGYPNARFVSLKEVKKEAFIVTGPLTSRKGLELGAINKAALTFWWAATERQVRIQGDVILISQSEADKYFAERNRASQIISNISNQGELLDNPETLDTKYKNLETLLDGGPVPRPSDWGGFALEPQKIEFLAFLETRFHHRILFQKVKGEWLDSMLQP